MTINKNTILDEIIASKAKEVELCKSIRTQRQLESDIEELSEPRGFCQSVLETSKHHPAIIAEVKRGSPSLGNICPGLVVNEQVKLYENGGAAALSILTDKPYFFATESDIGDAHNTSQIPILRKEFIIDEYQIYESRALRADCILLIMSAISVNDAVHFTNIAHDLNMDVLAEVHSFEELKYVVNEVDCDLIGINNRNLKTFETSESKTIELASNVNDKSKIVAESGLHSTESIKKLWDHGIRIYLIGEALIRSPKPDKTIESFINIH